MTLPVYRDFYAQFHLWLNLGVVLLISADGKGAVSIPDPTNAAESLSREQLVHEGLRLYSHAAAEEARGWVLSIHFSGAAMRGVLVEVARALIRGVCPAEGFNLLDAALAGDPEDIALAVSAGRLISKQPEASQLVATILRRQSENPDHLSLRDTVTRVLLRRGRCEDAAECAKGLEIAAGKQPAFAILLCDVESACGRHEAAIMWLRRSENLALTPAQAADIRGRLVREEFLSALVALHGTDCEETWSQLRSMTIENGVPVEGWDSLVRVARDAGRMAYFADVFSAALEDVRVRPQVESFYVEAEAERPAVAARRLAELEPADLRRAIRIDTLLADAGIETEANFRARGFLKANPEWLALAHRLLDRLSRRCDWNAIDEICSEGLTALPGDGGWMRSWAAMMVKAGRVREAVDLCRRGIELVPHDAALSTSLANYLLRMGEPQEALEIAIRVQRQRGNNAELAIIAAEALNALGRRDEMIDAITEARSSLEVELEYSGRENGNAALRLRLDWLQIVVDTGELISSVAVAEPAKGVVAILTQRSPLVMLWTGIAACEMRRRGYETVYLDSPSVLPFEPADPELKALNGAIDPTGRRFVDAEQASGPHPDWPGGYQRNIERNGYDLYQPITERIATAQRRYRIIEGKQADELAKDGMVRADVAMQMCERLANWSKQTGKRVLIFSSMTHYSPACIYKQFAARCSRQLPIEYVEFNAGYEQYKNNNTNQAGSTVSVANLTRNPDQRVCIHATRRAFEEWLSRRTADGEAERESDEILRLRRAPGDGSEAAKAAYDRLVAHRARGGKVVCLPGKITYDIAIEEEGGPAHRDMADWLNHTIEVVRGLDDVLLVIKPHPYEVIREIADPNEMFSDLIEVPLPDNCIVLGHRWFNLPEIMRYTDLVTLWHGTATLECLAQGVPVIVSAKWGVLDHPIEVLAPTDRANYAALITTRGSQSVNPATQLRARQLISYLVGDEVIIPYPYSKLSVLRAASVTRWGWNKECVDRYLANGDLHVTHIADLAEYGFRQPV
ncbi:hypothetical protein [Ciceribacter lividus]|nr:hypothetical protein [Ciceribacter lividus]